MVLEGLINPAVAKNKASHILFYGFVYGVVAFLISIWIFSSEAAMVTVFFSVLASMPLMYNLLKREEEIDLEGVDEKFVLKNHAKTLNLFMFLFFGFVLAFTFTYLISGFFDMPTASLFSSQLNAIQANNGPTGQTLQTCDKMCFFNSIFFNNLRVMLFSLLFSFLYGSGAIFILTWNASVIGVAIGITIRSGLVKFASTTGLEMLMGYMNVTTYGLTRYLLHGIPEILAYFVAGLAGGIISVAMIRHDFLSKKFNNVLTDISDLVLIAVALVFVAALIEVWITPMLF